MSICVNTPTKNGEKIVLFESIKKFTGSRELAAKTLGYAQSADYYAEFPEGLETDHQNYPTLKAVLEEWDWRDKVDFNSARTRMAVAEMSGFTKTTGSKTESIVLLANKQANWDKLEQQAIIFNRDSPFKHYYRAKVGPGYNNEVTGIKVNLNYIEKAKNTNFSLSVKERKYNEQLNTKLRQILFNAGVSIGALNELEKRIGASGAFDSTKLDNTVTGLAELIRLADGIDGEKALPEEFAHFAVEALIDNPIVQRSLANIKSNESYKEIIGEEYNKYYELYDGDADMLAKEALGKLLSNTLLENPVSPSLFNRLISTIKNFFKGLKDSNVDNDILSAKNVLENDLNNLASNILSGKLANELKASNIKNKITLLSVEKELSKVDKLLQDIIEVEVKKYKVFSEKRHEFDEKQKGLIDNLQRNILTDTALQGVAAYTKTAVEDMQVVQSKLDNIVANYRTGNLKETAKVLKQMKDYVDAYDTSLELITDSLNDARREGNEELVEALTENINKLSRLIKDVKKDYEQISAPIWLKFIEKFIPEKALINPFIKDKDGNPTKTTLDEIIRESKDDVSFLNRWFSVLGQMNDASLRIMDDVVKDVQETKRLNALRYEKELKAAEIELEATGIKSTAWAIEKDENGVPTGKYISDILQSKFDHAYSKMTKEAVEKTKDLGSMRNYEYGKIVTEWVKANTEIVNGKTVPKKSIYGNKVYSSLTEAQLKYLNLIKEIKDTMDSYLPLKYDAPGNIVMIRKDLLERAKSDPKNVLKEHLKDMFTRREQDIDEFGNPKGANTTIDFAGNEVMSIPVYYTQKLSNMSDVSEDVTGTMIAYVDMALNYKSIEDVVDILELGKEVILNKDVTVRKGGQEQKQSIKGFGEQVLKTLTKKGEKSNIGEALQDYFNAQLYGRFRLDQGNIGKTNLDYAKTLDSIGMLTALHTQSFAMLGGISNIITGKTMAGIEAATGQFFSHKNLLNSDKNYGKEVLGVLGEVGNRVKVSKLSLFEEKFDTLDDKAKSVRDTQMDRKTWLSRAAKMNSLFFISNAGEHYMQNRTFLALADAYKMLDNNGKEIDLYEAFEVRYIDPNNHSKGATLEIKEGYTKLDGTQFNEEDVKDFTRKGKEINHQLHGIYSKADMASIQKYAEGRLAMMFRKFLPIGLTRRYGKSQYNYNLDEWTEGYYRTAGRFLLQVAKDIKSAEFQNKAYFKNMSPVEKANLKRAATETAILLSTILALSLLEMPDDKDRPWLAKLMQYQMLRLRADLSLMTPTPMVLTEGFQLISSPAAPISYAKKVSALLSPKIFETIPSGKDKGMNWGVKKAIDLLPIVRNVEGILHPELRSKFFTGNY